MIGFISTVMPRKERVLKQKKTALKRAAEDQGQTKLTFFKAPRSDPDASRKETSISVTESLGESSVNQEAQGKEIDEDVAHGEKTNEEDDNSNGSSEDSPSTKVVKGAVQEESSHQQQGIKRAYDLADIVLGRKSLTDLTDEEKYNYLKYHFKPSATEKLFSLKISKNGKEKTLSYQHSWLEERSWHVYSPELSGGLCKMCVLFDRPHKKTQRGAFVATAFQKVQRSELIKAHAETDYHKAAVAQGSEFMRTFMHPESSVEADKSSAQYYQRNKHVLGAIVDAVLLCTKQGLPLRGHRDTKVNDVVEGTGNTGNFLAIMELIAKYDPVVKEHLKNGQRNAKMLSWKTQNDIIANAALVIKNQIKDMIYSEQFYAVIGDEVTERFTNKEVLLVCLRYLTSMDGEPKVEETFFQSVHMKGRTSGKNLGQNIVEVLKSNELVMADCRGQAYDGAAAMSSDRCGAQAEVRKEAPNAAYTHCRSHVINLAIVAACKNQSITNMMDVISSVNLFYEFSPKRKWYFEKFLDFFGEEMGLTEVQRKDIVSLARTRWVERHRAFESYYLLYRANVAVMESIFKPQLYSEFYDLLRNEFEEEWAWDSETKTKAQGLYASCTSFAHIVSFITTMNGMEPLRPLVKKLQGRNQDIFQAYHMIDSVIEDLCMKRANVEKDFADWYEQAVKMAQSVDVQPNKLRTAKCWSRFRNNVESDGIEDYLRRSVAVPFLDSIITQLKSRLADRNQVELFNLLPSLMLSKEFDVDNAVEILKSKFSADMEDDGLHFKSELVRWKRYWEKEMANRKEKSAEMEEKRRQENQRKALLYMHDKRRRNPEKSQLRCNGRQAYVIPEPPDSLLDALRVADRDIFPSIRKLLVIGCISPIGSCEAERAASGGRRLKTAYRSTMASERESHLNLIQMRPDLLTTPSAVVDAFIEQQPRRMFSPSILFE